MSEPVIPLGIHISLPANEYHDDPGLGSTDIKDLVLDPIEWQFERLQGEKPKSKQMQWGSLLHSRVLEGKKAANELVKSDPEILKAIKTGEELKTFLEDNNIPPKHYIIDRAIQAATLENVSDLWPDIEMAAEWMQFDEKIGPLMTNGTFIEGLPEVSIITEIEGIRRKARFDRLLGHAVVDLKSFSPQGGNGDIHEIVSNAISRLDLDIQTMAYLQVWHAGRHLYEQGKVYGDDAGLIEQVYKHSEPMWIWIFVKNTGAPQCCVRDMEEGALIYDNAHGDIALAIQQYKYYMKKFGPDKYWIPSHPAKKVGDYDVPAYHGNRRQKHASY